MGWAVGAVLYLLGCSLAKDMYMDELRAQGQTVNTRAEWVSFAINVAIWPLTELHHLIFERGE
jgi:hypothetical protein